MIVDRPALPAILLLCVAVGVACSADADYEGKGEIEAFIERDSAGVRLASTSLSAFPELPWEVESTPDLEIGADTSAGQFYRVNGVDAIGSNQFVVVDESTPGFRVFDMQGRLVRQVGRRGEGPGEFFQPVLLPSPGDEALVVFDAGRPRIQRMSPDGGGQEEVSLRSGWPVGRRPPLGLVDGQALIERSDFIGGEAALFEPGLLQVRRSFAWYDLEAAEETPLATFVVDWTYGSIERRIPAPFAAHPAVLVVEDGVFITDGRSWEIRKYGIEGDLLQILRIEAPDRPMTPEAVATLHASVRDQDDVPIPETLPVFDALERDARGHLWARLYDPDDSVPSRWIVFREDGSVRGIVRTPAGVDVWEIGDGFLLGVWRDEWDVEHLHRYSLQDDRSPRNEP